MEYSVQTVPSLLTELHSPGNNRTNLTYATLTNKIIGDEETSPSNEPNQQQPCSQPEPRTGNESQRKKGVKKNKKPQINPSDSFPFTGMTFPVHGANQSVEKGNCLQ
ncbi:hypothetical protein BJX96DRAFT_155252 [Aspergillus floccosus]